MKRYQIAIVALLLTLSVAEAFLQIDDTNVQTILTGAIKTFQDAIHFQATGGGSNYVGIVGPATVPTSTTFKLPSADGTSGQAMVTDGSANLSFATFVQFTPTPQPTATPGVGSCPAGSNTQVQYDNSGSCGGTAGWTWDSAVSGWTLAGGTLPLDGSKNWIHETGTFTGTAANTPTPAVPQAANFIDVTGNGVGNRQVAQKIYVESGYTGTNATLGLDLFNNTQAVPAPTPFLFYSSSYPQGNYAAYSQVANNQAGNTIGFVSDVVSGAATLAAGFIARVTTSNTGHNVGIGALANAQGGPGHAGYFILHGSSTQPTLYTTTNAAVVGGVSGLTNGAQFLGLEGEPPIEVFRVSRSTGSAINGVDFESANSGGIPSMNATSKGGSPDTNVSYGINALGTGAVKVKHPGGGGASFTAGAVTCAGGTPDLHGTDSAFQITSGTGACTFSWKSTWNHAPACACSNETTPANTIAIQATTTLATIVGTKVNGELIDCICQSWTD